MTLQLWIKDTAERALSTLVQHLAVFLPLLLGPWNAELGEAIIASIVPALVTVLVNAVPAFRPAVTVWWMDVGLRILRTFVATVGGLVTADSFNVLEAASWKGALTAGLVAVSVVLKGAWAKEKSNTITPASFAERDGSVYDDRGYTVIEWLVGVAAVFVIIIGILWLFGGDRFD